MKAILTSHAKPPAGLQEGSANAAAGDTAKARQHWPDIARALAIIMVVVNHSVTGIDVRLPVGDLRHAVDFVHIFNLSTFYFVSGLFIWRSVEHNPRRYLLDMAQKVYYPMVLWNLIIGTALILADTEAGKEFGFAALVLRGFFWPHTLVAFLLSLILCRLLFLGARMLQLPRKSMLLISLPLIVLYGLFGYHQPIELPIALDGLFLMALAGLIAPSLGPATVSRIPTFLLAGVALFALGLLLINEYALSSTVYASYFRLVAARICGVVMVVSLAIILERLPYTEWLRFLGRHSLEIFLAHHVFCGAVRVVLHNLLNLGNPHIIWALMLAAGILAPLFLSLVTRKQYLFVWPTRKHQNTPGSGSNSLRAERDSAAESPIPAVKCDR